MPQLSQLPRRLWLLLLAFSALVAIIFLTTFHTPLTSPLHVSFANALDRVTGNASHPVTRPAGGVIMPKLGNATAKAELGRAAWKLLHTVMARFPDEPTADERVALKDYIHLFTRLYPCGECAQHFTQIIAKFPPQVSSRSAAAVWACHVHNEVNKSLEKDLFDCSQIGDFYDCGCADDEKEAMGAAAKTGKLR